MQEKKAQPWKEEGFDPRAQSGNEIELLCTLDAWRMSFSEGMAIKVANFLWVERDILIM